MKTPAAAGGDTAEFLDVDVDHRAGGIMFKADHFAELVTGGRVDVTQTADSPPHQDPMDSGRGHGDAVAAP